MASLGQTCRQFVHWWHNSVLIMAFLSSEETTIALEGQAFSQSLQPTQASLSTFSDSRANLPKLLWRAPNGQMRLWNTAGLYLSVISIDITSQNGRIGKSMCSSLFDRSITATLIPKVIHVKYPFFSHLGATAVWSFNIFDSHVTGTIRVFMGQTYPQ